MWRRRRLTCSPNFEAISSFSPRGILNSFSYLVWIPWWGIAVGTKVDLLLFLLSCWGKWVSHREHHFSMSPAGKPSLKCACCFALLAGWLHVKPISGIERLGSNVPGLVSYFYGQFQCGLTFSLQLFHILFQFDEWFKVLDCVGRHFHSRVSWAIWFGNCLTSKAPCCLFPNECKPIENDLFLKKTIKIFYPCWESSLFAVSAFLRSAVSLSMWRA